MIPNKVPPIKTLNFNRPIGALDFTMQTIQNELNRQRVAAQLEPIDFGLNGFNRMRRELHDMTCERIAFLFNRIRRDPDWELRQQFTSLLDAIVTDGPIHWITDGLKRSVTARQSHDLEPLPKEAEL